MTGGEPGPRVGDLGLSPPVWLDDDATIRDAAQAMDTHAVSAVIVGPHGAIVTERDVVRAVAAGQSTSMRAAPIASPATITAPADANPLDALREMLIHGVRHLVIVDANGRPCAVLPLAGAAAASLER
ncbi:MAG: CBS domain-containing protein, partial [Acidimicrobiia bacterium]